MLSGTAVQYINCNTIFFYFYDIMYTVQYVGHTSQCLKNCIRKHLSDIPHHASCNISNASLHFAQVHSGNTESCQVQGMERVILPHHEGNMKRKLLKRETYWIFKLTTCVPFGLNKKNRFDTTLLTLYVCFLCIYT